MNDPDNQSKKKESKKKKFKESEQLKQSVNFLWDRRIEFFSGALVLVGIILAFFYIHLGGALVGLGFGICFFEEIHNYFVQLRDYYVEQGVFKTLMIIGSILYFLIAIPAFIVAAAIGYGAIFLIRWVFKK